VKGKGKVLKMHKLLRSMWSSSSRLPAYSGLIYAGETAKEHASKTQTVM